jgi:PAS domain-containing protein
MKRFLVGDDIFEKILDGIPSPIFLVDDDVQIYGYNRAAADLFGKKPEKVLRMGCGDALHCIQCAEGKNGCGEADACKQCIIRNLVNETYNSGDIQRNKGKFKVIKNSRVEEIYLIVTTAPLKYKNNLFALVTLEDITELVELKGLLPICAKCKKIRDDEGYWEKIEKYIHDRTDARFTHSICPDCAKELYPF